MYCNNKLQSINQSVSGNLDSFDPAKKIYTKLLNDGNLTIHCMIDGNLTVSRINYNELATQSLNYPNLKSYFMVVQGNYFYPTIEEQITTRYIKQ